MPTNPTDQELVARLPYWIRQTRGWLAELEETVNNFPFTPHPFTFPPAPDVPIISPSVTYNIPSDYPTLQSAIDDLSTNIIPHGDLITLNIESGHALTEGLKIVNGNYSQFLITSTDPEIALSSGFTGKLSLGDAAIPAYHDSAVFMFINCIAPTVKVLVDANDAPVAGITYVLSKGYILPDSGVKNANRMGLSIIQNSIVSANKADFSGAGGGNRVTTNSFAFLFSIDLSGMRNVPEWDETQTSALDVSRGSVVDLSANELQIPSNLSGSAKHGLSLRRSWVAASYVNLANTTQRALRCSLNSVVSADNANLSNSTGRAVICLDGSKVDCSGANISNCGERALFADNGGKINACNADLTNATDRTVWASNGSDINITNADVTGSGDGDVSVGCYRGSIIRAFDLSIENVGRFSITINEVNEHGIIFYNDF